MSELTPEKKEVLRAMDALIAHGRGEILVVISPGPKIDILAGKRTRYEKGVDKTNISS